MTTYSFTEHGFGQDSSRHNQVDFFNSIKKQIDEHFPTQQNFLINTTWISFQYENLIAAYNSFGHIDNLFLCALLDNMDQPIPMPNNNNVNIFQIGNVETLGNHINYELSMAAITLSKIFKKYDSNELLPNNSPMVPYLCYQNKPHSHRQILTKTLIEANLLNKGIITLGKYNDQAYIFPELTKLEIDEPINEDYYYSSHGLSKENPYSLGDINVWKKCFLNVISESSYSSSRFITEKTYKPLIGLRPFILNGNPNILTYLKAHGFYTFEEYWPNVKFRDCNTMEQTASCVASVLHLVCAMTPNELTKMYAEMLPKLTHNRMQFFEHATKQEYKLNHLFNT